MSDSSLTENPVHKIIITQEEEASSSGSDKQPASPVKKLAGVKIHSNKLNLDFTAYLQDETNPNQQRCYIMTLHDLGCDCN